jgi:hypothetical protein
VAQEFLKFLRLKLSWLGCLLGDNILIQLGEQWFRRDQSLPRQWETETPTSTLDASGGTKKAVKLL